MTVVQLPLVAIIGRPNVGKSTLFNRLVGRRKALVRDVAGVTRDRLYGTCHFDHWAFRVVDTGGFDPAASEDLIVGVRNQVRTAIEEAEVLLFLIDGVEGVTPMDREVSRALRRTRKPVLLVANKIDDATHTSLVGEAYQLGFPQVFGVSAEHGRGVAELLEAVVQRLPVAEEQAEGEVVRLAIVGRPNVGKSSLVNAILGEERVLVHPKPGTTRDAVDAVFEEKGRRYVVVDTAGIRRKGRVEEPLEKLTVVMALKSIEHCDIALLMLDPTQEVASQDAKIGGYAHEAGRGCIVVVNKWDLVDRSKEKIHEITESIRTHLAFLDYAPIVFVSARTGYGIPALFAQIGAVAAGQVKRIPTSELNSLLEEITDRHPPASMGGRHTKLFYVTQTGVKPPTFVIFTNRPEAIHFSYGRYLENCLRRAFGFQGTPVRLRFRRRVKSARRV